MRGRKERGKERGERKVKWAKEDLIFEVVLLFVHLRKKKKRAEFFFQEQCYFSLYVSLQINFFGQRISPPLLVQLSFFFLSFFFSSVLCQRPGK